MIERTSSPTRSAVAGPSLSTLTICARPSGDRRAVQPSELLARAIRFSQAE